MSATGDDDSGSLTPRQRRALSRRPSDRAIIATLAITGLIAAFLQTLVTPIIPHLPDLLSTTSADASWVLTSTLLAAAISTPISGRLGDMYGKRRILLTLLMIMVAGSVISALSNTLIPMIVGRVLQGVGLGVIALGISILRDVIHPKNLAGAVALVSATLGIGGALGLPLAATIAQYLDWHFLFWLAAGFGVVAIVLVALIVPVSTLRSEGRFDLPGAIGLAVGLVGILLAISKGNEWGWASPVTLALLIGGVAVLIGWGFFQLRTVDPLIDLRVAARRPVLLTNLSSIAVGFAFFVVTASLPILLEAPIETEIGLGLPLILASLCLTPLGIVMFILSPVSAKLTNRHGARTSLILGGVIVTIAFVFAIFFLSEVWHIVVISAVVGVGVAFSYGAMPTLIMQAVPPSETAAANGLNSVMRTLGSSVSATMVGVILATHVAVQGDTTTPSREGFEIVFIMATAVMILGVVLAVFIPRASKGYDTASIPVIKPSPAPGED